MTLARQLNVPLIDPSGYSGVGQRGIQSGLEVFSDSELISDPTVETYCTALRSRDGTRRHLRGAVAAADGRADAQVQDARRRHGRLQTIARAAEVARGSSRRLPGACPQNCVGSPDQGRG